jgi:PAS domain S-box-containing protein
MDENACIANAFVEKVIKSQEHWQATIDAVRDYIFVVNSGWAIIKANISFAERFGKHPRDIVGMNANDLLCFALPPAEAIATDADRACGFASREIVVKDCTFIISAFPTRYDDEAVTVYIMKDITELISLKNKLYYAYKLASLGRLVSGVAHELNNPLTGILGYSEILGTKVKDAEIARDIEKIHRSAERCKIIIDSLLCFSRQQPPQKSLEYINDIIDRTITLRAYWHRNQGIEVIREYAEDMPLAYIDVQQIQQVIMNMLMNAEQAIAESASAGRITVKAWPEKERGRIMVSIADNGVGIPAENLPRIFDPFYTTKPVSKGTGLGLSISYGIVVEHGGMISVESSQGNGAKFLIDLPLK